jgi:hypothetical protein
MFVQCVINETKNNMVQALNNQVSYKKQSRIKPTKIVSITQESTKRNIHIRENTQTTQKEGGRNQMNGLQIIHVHSSKLSARIVRSSSHETAKHKLIFFDG